MVDAGIVNSYILYKYGASTNQPKQNHIWYLEVYSQIN